MASNRSASKRFGGTWHWELDDNGQELCLSEAIQGEATGEGVAIYPWILDKYERILRLRPRESWLLRRLMKHAWTFGGEVFVSLRRITLEADVTRSTLQTYMKRLEELSYVRVLSNGTRVDKRKRYDVSGVYAALAICIAADPTSKWAKRHGGPLPLESAKVLGWCGANCQHGAVLFDLDWDALRDLAERAGLELIEQWDD